MRSDLLFHPPGRDLAGQYEGSTRVQHSALLEPDDLVGSDDEDHGGEDETWPLTGLLCYVALLALTLFSYVHTVVIMLMFAAAGAVVFLDLHARLTARLPGGDIPGCRLVASDILRVAKLMSFTFLPALLASVGGASFVFWGFSLGGHMDSCSVAGLQQYAQGSALTFACQDGYVAVDVQASVPAEGRHLGFVAPIYESLDAFNASRAPVAWAVKAGSPVRRPACAQNGRTCGFFAEPLRRAFLQILAPPAYGEAWGFNLTYFPHWAMLEAVDRLRILRPDLNLGTDPSTPLVFVVAEGRSQYFGIAYPLLGATAVLLFVGLLDKADKLLKLRKATYCQSGDSGRGLYSRLEPVSGSLERNLDGQVAEEDEEDADELEGIADGLSCWACGGGSGSGKRPKRGLLVQAISFWGNPLNTKESDTRSGQQRL